MKNTTILLAAATLVLTSWNCAKPLTAEELFARAESKRNVKNFPGALEDLETLVNKYPEHELVAKSRYFVGDIYMNNMKDFQSAITAYRKVVELHQGSGMDANAQFLIGFIFVRIIHAVGYPLFERSFLNSSALSLSIKSPIRTL